MRDIKHYLTLFADTEAVGAQLLARALAAGGDSRDLRDITRSLDENTPSERATRLVASTALVAAAEDDDPGPLVRQVRDGCGWSRSEMGKKLGLPVQGYKCRTLADWETGARAPDWEGRKAIRALGRELGEGG